ncbi:MAG: type II toxin-antitoxin system VapC family toxin [Actinomycetota bacterium]
MTLLLDTSALIGLSERLNPAVIALLTEVGDEDVHVSAISFGELGAGVRRAVIQGLDPALVERRRATVSDARSLVPIDIDDAVVECYEIVASLAARRVGQNDQWIIASAMTHGHDLVTEDVEQATLMNSDRIQSTLRASGFPTATARFVAA